MPTRRELLVSAAGATLAAALPSTAAARPLGGTPLALITADTESHVVVVNLNSGKVERRIRTLPGPRSIESAGGQFAVIAHTALGRLTVIDASTLSVRRVLGGMEEPRYTAIEAGSMRAYVTDSAARELVVVSLRSGRVVSRTRVPGPARHVTLSPDGSVVWAALGSKAETVAVLAAVPTAVDAGRLRLVRALRPPGRAHDVVFAPDGRHVWVTSGTERRIWVFEAEGRRPVAELPADAPPQHVAWVNGLAFVASGDSGTVRVHRPDGTLVRETAVPDGSYNVTFGWQRAVTPSLARGTVTLLDRRGRVLSERRVAKAAHDACVVVGQ